MIDEERLFRAFPRPHYAIPMRQTKRILELFNEVLYVGIYLSMSICKLNIFNLIREISICILRTSINTELQKEKSSDIFT